MGYSIGQVAKKTGLTAHTLRYYEKEGLLPFVQKSGSGLRVFSENDLGWLAMIECLKGTGMTLKDIKQYIDWFIEGDSTLEKRLDMFKRQKVRVAEQMAQLQQHMEKINYKIAYYSEAVKRGSTDDVLEHNKWLAAEKERLFGKQNNQ
ncbi:MAG: MerR family transcriptional regulator [Proteobacteria bacterium]|nr:MerR family transcriptional regulator [Pseudomonadota bacterium]